MGEIYKTTFPNQKKDGVHIEEFVKKGVEVINNFNTIFFDNLDLDDYIKVFYINFVLNEINNDVYIKRLISKDATASCFQHLIKILGYASEDSLKWCNLSSKNRWYDTYLYIIELFKKNVKLEYLSEDEFNYIFSRKLKRIIMTHSYSAKERRCWEYFLQVIDLSIYEQEKINEITTLFKNFYNFLENNTAILKHTPQVLIHYFDKNEKTIIFENQSRVNLKYNKKKSIQKEIKFAKARYTYTDIILLPEENVRKFKTSIKPNYIHSLDGYLAFWVRKQFKTLTIHDCFLCDYIQISYLIAKLNEGMRLFFHDIQLDSKINTDELFSIFILI